jgi:hypothetical protein
MIQKDPDKRQSISVDNWMWRVGEAMQENSAERPHKALTIGQGNDAPGHPMSARR